MQAMVQGAYGGPDRLRLSEVEAPTLAPGSVLVRMRASSVNMADRLSMRGMPYIMRVVGGSLGAAALNDALPDALARLPHAQRPLTVHQAGERHIDALRARYAEAGVT